MHERLSSTAAVAALAASLLAAVPAVAAERQLPFIHDDLAAARAEATRRGVPIVVDLWAGW